MFKGNQERNNDEIRIKKSGMLRDCVAFGVGTFIGNSKVQKFCKKRHQNWPERARDQGPETDVAHHPTLGVENPVTPGGEPQHPSPHTPGWKTPAPPHPGVKNPYFTQHPEMENLSTPSARGGGPQHTEVVGFSTPGW